MAYVRNIPAESVVINKQIVREGCIYIKKASTGNLLASCEGKPKPAKKPVLSAPPDPGLRPP